jgi:adenine deaminase
MQIQGQIVDIANRRIYSGELTVANGKITSITAKEHTNKTYLLPGFIDAHIHIESSMLVPSEFAKLAVLHGTVATISDPHEIANVLGKDGVYYMIENSKKYRSNFILARHLAFRLRLLKQRVRSSIQTVSRNCWPLPISITSPK